MCPDAVQWQRDEPRVRCSAVDFPGIVQVVTLRFILLLAATLVVVINWSCVIVSCRNKRRGIDRHHSVVPVVSAILVVVVAWLIGPQDGRHWMFFIPVVDIGNLMVLWLPVWLMLGGPKRNEAPGSTDPSDQPPADSEDLETGNDNRS